VTTGYDFAGKLCEYQIVAKIPFPDRRNPVVAARTDYDKEYPAYVAMQELVQAVGRGMRSADDQCETAIFDSNCSWFMRAYRHLAPEWFLSAYRRVETLPTPPDPL
jgi:Rad3-related DNA helicase